MANVVGLLSQLQPESSGYVLAIPEYAPQVSFRLPVHSNSEARIHVLAKGRAVWLQAARQTGHDIDGELDARQGVAALLKNG